MPIVCSCISNADFPSFQSPSKPIDRLIKLIRYQVMTNFLHANNAHTLLHQHASSSSPIYTTGLCGSLCCTTRCMRCFLIPQHTFTARYIPNAFSKGVKVDFLFLEKLSVDQSSSINTIGQPHYPWLADRSTLLFPL